jgi:alginate O-acetyltransferase complex protein AlgI
MSFSVSLLDAKYVLLLALLPLLRLVWPKRYYLWLLLSSTAVIIGLGAPKTLLLISAITILFIYPLLWLKRRAEEKRWPPIIITSLMPVGIGGMVAILVVFKLYNEFALPWLGAPWLRQEVLALVGFSYFVFRAISVLRISSILKIRESSPWVMLSYTLFPPTITSGPIQKYQDFREQVANPAPLTRTLVHDAIYRITRGYFRKIVIGLVLNGLVLRLLDNTAFTVWSSLLTIALMYFYFYYDFAGYSDIAIGFGLLLGIRVPENFRKPFLATTVSEFWRNWHITLVDWLREHVYIPLGGMRSSRSRAAALVFLIMMLCGLWHGMTISFIIWGLWHGTWLAYEAISGSGPLPPALRHGPKYWGRVLWTNARVAITGILFLPDSETIYRVLHGFVRLGL